MLTSDSAMARFVAVLGLLLWAAGITESAIQEYCQLETFEASCAKDEVVLVKSAKYGRMKVGRCLTRDYFVGCDADVLTRMDQLCSGRRQCKVTLPDAPMFNSQPCPKDLMAYMEADFECVKVVSDPVGTQKTCRSHHRLELSHPEGYLSSLAAETLGVGGRECPWVLRAKKGQQIRLTLMDFSLGLDAAAAGKGGTSKSQGSNICRVYAHVQETIDGKPGKDHVVCSGQQRITTVYTSKTSVITVQLQSQGPVTLPGEEQQNVTPQFLIKYEAIGCPEPPLPPGAWLQRDGDKLDVMCNRTVRSWHLVCKGTEWVGEIGTCHGHGDMPRNVEHRVGKDRLLHFPNGILIAVMIGVALGIFLGFVLLSAIIMQRRSRREKQRREQQLAREENSLLGCTDTYKQQQHHHQQQQPIYLERVDAEHMMAICPEHGTKVDIPMATLARQRPPGPNLYEATKAEDQQGTGPKNTPEPYYREFAPVIDVDLTKPARTASLNNKPQMRTNLDITDVC